MRSLILLAAAALLAACSTPTAPAPKPHFDTITCRTGYAIAQRADGTYYCEPV